MLWDFVADNAARKVALAHGLAAGGAREDRLLRLLFCEVSGDQAVVGQANEQVHVFSLLVGDVATSGREHVQIVSFLSETFKLITHIDISLIVVEDVLGFSDGLCEICGS